MWLKKHKNCIQGIPKTSLTPCDNLMLILYSFDFSFLYVLSIWCTLLLLPIAKLKMWLLINSLPIPRRLPTVNTSFAGISKWSGKSLVHTFVHRCEQMHTRVLETHLNFKGIFVWNAFVRFQVLFSLRALSEQDEPFVSAILQPVCTYHWLNPLLWQILLPYLTARGQHFMLLKHITQAATLRW